MSLAEAQKGILATAKIEFDVYDGKRPKTVLCENCGRSIRVSKLGPVPSICLDGCPCDTEGCTNLASYSASKSKRKRRQPVKCRDCAVVEAGRKVSAAHFRRPEEAVDATE